ncbi:MAG: 50S ribosomal protein L6 [Euryarchaeota archaeon]|nr:50S ribosomal protein L6 [Euryarchaeota archaeon]|tara:strand:- start:5 stop:553 length:549 start_codon:yes stop_codon:yes gene_type:complete
MVKMDHIKHVIELSDGVGASISDGAVTLNKDGKSISREFIHARVSVSVNDGNVEVFCDLPRRKERALAGTWAAHLRNMNKGLSEGFEYRLKAVYSHFPMTLKVEGSVLVINNLFGERVPRRAPLPWSPADVTVKVENKTEVVVSGIDKEKVGQTSANIERACRIRGRDRRVFQDGIYIVEKA